MPRRLSTTRKSKGCDLNEPSRLEPAQREQDEPRDSGTITHVLKIFRIFGRHRKSGKSGPETKSGGNADDAEVETKSSLVGQQTSSSSSKPIKNDVEMNPNTISFNEIDLSRTYTSSNNRNDDTSSFGHNLLHKLSLQKLMRILAGANKRKQELLKRKTEEKATGAATAFYLDEEKTNEDASARLNSTSNTSVNLKTEESIRQFSSTSAPANSPRNAPDDSGESQNYRAKIGDEAGSETLDLLQSVCNRLASENLNFGDNSSRLSINFPVKDDNSGTGSYFLNMDMESDYDSESESVDSSNLMFVNETAADSNETSEDDKNDEDTTSTKNSNQLAQPSKNEDGITTALTKVETVVIGDVADLGKSDLIKSQQNSIPPPFMTREDSKAEAYSIVEHDIKSMIKELLSESKTIKESIVSSGISEDDIPFTYEVTTNTSNHVICRSICDDLINAVTSTIYKNLNNLNIPPLKEASISIVSYIIDVLLEQVWGRRFDEKLGRVNYVTVNYCLVNNDDVFKYDSKVYSAAVKFWQNNRNRSNPQHSLKLPLVNIRNSSPTPRINVFKTEENLANRVRKSAALLLALYEEMRDYSSHTTSSLFNDLYEMFSKRHAPFEKLREPKSEEAGTSCSKLTSGRPGDLLPACSDSSFCSSEIDEEVRTSGFLTNLKYSCVSEEELNTSEEIETIEANAIENRDRNPSLGSPGDEFSIGMDVYDDDVINSGNEDVFD